MEKIKIDMHEYIWHVLETNQGFPCEFKGFDPENGANVVEFYNFTEIFYSTISGDDDYEKMHDHYPYLYRLRSLFIEKIFPTTWREMEKEYGKKKIVSNMDEFEAPYQFFNALEKYNIQVKDLGLNYIDMIIQMKAKRQSSEDDHMHPFYNYKDDCRKLYYLFYQGKEMPWGNMDRKIEDSAETPAFVRWLGAYAGKGFEAKEMWDFESKAHRQVACEVLVPYKDTDLLDVTVCGQDLFAVWKEQATLYSGVQSPVGLEIDMQQTAFHRLFAHDVWSVIKGDKLVPTSASEEAYYGNDVWIEETSFVTKLSKAKGFVETECRPEWHTEAFVGGTEGIKFKSILIKFPFDKLYPKYKEFVRELQEASGLPIKWMGDYSSDVEYKVRGDEESIIQKIRQFSGVSKAAAKRIIIEAKGGVVDFPDPWEYETSETAPHFSLPDIED